MNGGTKSGVSTISLDTLQCARRDSAGPTNRRRRTTTKKKEEEGEMRYTVEPGYNDIGLYDTSHITSDILWCQSVPRCYP
jgi:hypothetical protein